MPAVVGGGLGDIEETLAAGRRLVRAGFRLRLYRSRGRPLPRSVEGPWDWPPIERTDRIERRAPAALTVTPAWGISAAPSRAGAYGRGGPWEVEATELEAAYGGDHLVHASLEEFARTLTNVRENRERLREGGVAARESRLRLRRAQDAGEVTTFRTAFRRFRAFDRPNVLHLFATFRRDRGFAREFPEAVQTGPLWPDRYRRRPGSPARGDRPEWVWYACPASAERLAPAVLEALESVRPVPYLWVLAPRPWALPLPGDRATLIARPVEARVWARRFSRADLRIVTGSRTLLEAMELGGPFLYFNGILGLGGRTRRHRPEKLAALLDLARRGGMGRPLRRDLADFARGQRVREVVARAATRADGWSDFPSGWNTTTFAPPFDDAGALLVAVARALGRQGARATELVARVRSGLPP